VYNLGSGRATTFNEIVGAIGGALGRGGLEPEYFEMPESIGRFYQDFTCADMSAAARGLGWRPAHDPLAAMERYAAYLAERPGRRAAGGSA
jgi:nucleoside-diphosphate-sugar epimerase